MDTHQVSLRRRQSSIVFSRQPPAVIAGAHKGHKCSNPHLPGLWWQGTRRQNRFVTSVPPMLFLTWDHGHTPGVSAPSSRRRQSLIVFRRKPPAVIAGIHKGHKCSNAHVPGLWQKRHQTAKQICHLRPTHANSDMGPWTHTRCHRGDGRVQLCFAASLQRRLQAPTRATSDQILISRRNGEKGLNGEPDLSPPSHPCYF
jgi:hypothetical protein